MSLISFSPLVDGSTAVAAGVNTPLSTIYNDYNGNITDANIAAGAAIAYSKLALPLTLGSGSITGNFTTTSATAVQVTGLTATVTVPAGRTVRISVFGSDMFASASAAFTLSIWDGVVNVGTQLGRALANNGGSTGFTVPAICEAIVTGVSGSKTYNVGLQTSGGTVTLEAGGNYAAFIFVQAL